MAPTVPNFQLPEVVIAFDFGLEAGFSWWRKDGNDTGAEAQVDQSPQTTGLLMRTLKASVIVELSEGGPADRTPIRLQTGQCIGGGEGGTRPGNGQTAVEGNAIKDFDRGDIFDRQTFDKIKGIQLGLTMGQLGQVPTRGRRQLTSARTLDQAMLGEDPRDGPLRRQARNLAFGKVAQDGRRPNLPQSGMTLEPEAR